MAYAEDHFRRNASIFEIVLAPEATKHDVEATLERRVEIGIWAALRRTNRSATRTSAATSTSEQRAKRRSLPMRLRRLCVPEGVEQQRARAVDAHQPCEPPLHSRRPEAKRRRRRHHVGPVTHGEHGITERDAQRARVVVRIAARCGAGSARGAGSGHTECRHSGSVTNSAEAFEPQATNNLIRHEGEQRLLIRHMVVQRAWLHPQFGSNPAHRTIFEPLSVKHPQGGCDHIGEAVAHYSILS